MAPKPRTEQLADVFPDMHPLPESLQDDILSTFDRFDFEWLTLTSKSARAFVHSLFISELSIYPQIFHELRHSSLNMALPFLRHMSLNLNDLRMPPPITPTAFLTCFLTHRSAWLAHLPSLHLTLSNQLPGEGVQQLARLMRACPGLQQLKVVIQSTEPCRPVSAAHPLGRPTMRHTLTLVFKPPAPASPLHELQDLFDNGLALSALLSTHACRHNLASVYGTTPDFLCGLPPAPSMAMLSALRSLSLSVSDGNATPSLLDDLTALTKLQLDVCQGSQTLALLNQLSRLTALAKLQFRGFMAPEPITVPPSWSRLHSLRQLALHHCLLSEHSGIWNLTGLQQLEINGCDMGQLFGQRFEHMPHLTRLSVKDMAIVPDASLRLVSLTQLLELELEGEAFEVPTALPPSLTKIQLLQSDTSQLQHLPRSWPTSLPHLRCLIWGSVFSGITALPILVQLTTLEELNLQTMVQGLETDLKRLSVLTRLTSLTLDKFPSLDATLHADLWQRLHAVGRLQALTLQYVTNWPQVLPRSLTSLRVKETFEAQLQPQLASCTGLKQLLVHYIPQGQDGPRGLTGLEVAAQLTGLRRLELLGLAGGPVGCLTALTRLTYLRLVPSRDQVLEGQRPTLKWPRQLEDQWGVHDRRGLMF